jgi:hypothetical protein
MVAEPQVIELNEADLHAKLDQIETALGPMEATLLHAPASRHRLFPRLKGRDPIEAFCKNVVMSTSMNS